MRVATFLTILSTFVGFTAAAYPAAYAARAAPSKRYASPAVYAARAAPSKRYASPVEPRAVNHPSARYVNRAQPSSHYEAREPAPAPSKRASRRDVHEQTALVNIDSILCPYGMAACPVNRTPALPKSLDEWAGLEHECVEFETDLQSCGGCASIDKSHDCNATPGALNVACVFGKCQVQSCDTGYRVSSDLKSCIAR